MTSPEPSVLFVESSSPQAVKNSAKARPRERKINLFIFFIFSSLVHYAADRKSVNRIVIVECGLTGITINGK